MSYLVDTGASPDTEFGGDTVGGVEYPLTKLAWGPAGVVKRVTEAEPLPVREPRKAVVGAIGEPVTDASSEIIPASATRDTWTLWNDADVTDPAQADAVIYLGLGTAAVVGVGPRIAPGESFGLTGYTGAIHAIHELAGESVNVCGFAG